MTAEIKGTLESIDSFLRLSREIGTDEALGVSISETNRKLRESTWQYRAKKALSRTQASVGLGNFTQRRIKKILGRVERDVNRVIDPVLAPVLESLITVVLHEP